MKIKKLIIDNVKSFKDRTEVDFGDYLNIFVGPNGGGKSNLLDIIIITLRHFLMKFYRIDRNQEMELWFEDINVVNAFQPINKYLEKYISDERDSFIEITLILSNEDIENIELLKKSKGGMEDVLRKYRRKPINNLDFINSWQVELFSENQELIYGIQNLNLVNPTDNPNKSFLEYLNYYELFVILGSEIKDFRLNPPLLYFSPYRMLGQANLTTNLSTVNFYESMSRYVQSTSKDTVALINLSLYRIAEKRRMCELNGGDYIEEFNKDEKVKLLRNYLSKLGYNWDIKCIDPIKNEYAVILERSGKRFSITQASSGEKEILNFY